MDISERKFEEWRKEQIASLVRMGYPDAAKAFRDLGSVQWAGWQAAWKESRKALTIDLPVIIDSEWACTSAECEAMRHGITLTKHKINAIGVRVK